MPERIPCIKLSHIGFSIRACNVKRNNFVNSLEALQAFFDNHLRNINIADTDAVEKLSNEFNKLHLDTLENFNVWKDDYITTSYIYNKWLFYNSGKIFNSAFALQSDIDLLKKIMLDLKQKCIIKLNSK